MLPADKMTLMLLMILWEMIFCWILFASGGDAIAEFLLLNVFAGAAECFCCFSVRKGCYYCLGIMNHFPVLLLLSCVVLSYAGL